MSEQTSPPAAEPDYITREQLVDALGCFWNAALYATHEAQDSTANAVMHGMVEGVAAVAERLKVRPPQEAPPSSVLLETLRKAEAFIAADREQVVEAGCLIDPATLGPRLETIDPPTADFVENHHDPLLAEIRAAIASAEVR